MHWFVASAAMPRVPSGPARLVQQAPLKPDRDAAHMAPGGIRPRLAEVLGQRRPRCWMRQASEVYPSRHCAVSLGLTALQRRIPQLSRPTKMRLDSTSSRLRARTDPRPPRPARAAASWAWTRGTHRGHALKPRCSMARLGFRRELSASGAFPCGEARLRGRCRLWRMLVCRLCAPSAQPELEPGVRSV